MVCVCEAAGLWLDCLGLVYLIGVWRACLLRLRGWGLVVTFGLRLLLFTLLFCLFDCVNLVGFNSICLHGSLLHDIYY